MNTVILVLRFVHVLGGVFWVGGALAMTYFITPTLFASAEAGQKVMGRLMTQTKFSLMMAIASITAVLAGYILYAIDSNWFTSAWMGMGPGIGFGIGGLIATIGLVAGMMIPRIGQEMAALGAQIKGAPTPEQASQMAALRKRQAVFSQVNAYSLIIATILMSVARYLQF